MNTTRLLKSALLLTLAALTSCASEPPVTSGRTNVEHDSASLQMLNAEQMNAIVLKKIKKAQAIQKSQEVDDDRGIVAEPEAIDQLRDATRLVFARPDQDGARSNIFNRLRRELTDMNALDDVLKDLTKEGINGVKDESHHSPREQATYIVLLENLMAEIKPEVGSNAVFKSLIEQIRDANLKISDRVRNQQLLRSMNRPVSPSETAAKIVPKK